MKAEHTSALNVIAIPGRRIRRCRLRGSEEERVMRRCHQCRGRFGLTRRYVLTFAGYLHFCSKECVADWRHDVEEAARSQKFCAWLARENPQT